MRELLVTYATWKQVVLGLQSYYTTLATGYKVFAASDAFLFSTEVSLAGDITDFEDNYKSSATEAGSSDDAAALALVAVGASAGFDLDTGAGVKRVTGTNLRLSSSGGSVEAKGQKAMAESIPVTISSDQSNVNTSANNVVSTGNSTSTPLGAGATFPGATEEVKDYSTITVQVFADQNSATDGLSAEFSTDGTNWDVTDVYTITANAGKPLTLYPTARYFRIRYTNNATTAQTAFRLQTIYHRVRTKPSSHRIIDQFNGQNDAELVKGVMVGRIASTEMYGNVRTDSAGNLFTVSTASIQADPIMINLRFFASDGAIVAGSFKRVLEWNVPTGYFAYLIRFTTFQSEAAISRLTVVKEMGTLVISTNVFTSGDSYPEPQWSSVIEAEVTTEIGASTNLTITVTYTNEMGVSGRTGTFSIPKSSIVGARFVLTRQAGDLGVRSIQNLSSDATTSGAILILGHLQLMIHDDLATTMGLETIVGAGAITFPSGTQIHLEYNGGTVSKQRRLDALLQLVPE